MKLSAHVTESDLLDHVEGRSDPQASVRLAVHLEDCDTCRRRAEGYALLLAVAGEHRSVRDGYALRQPANAAFQQARAICESGTSHRRRSRRGRAVLSRILPTVLTRDVPPPRPVGLRAAWAGATLAVTLGCLAGFWFTLGKTDYDPITGSRIDAPSGFPANNSSALSGRGFIGGDLGQPLKEARPSFIVGLGPVWAEIRRVRIVKAPASPGPDLIHGPYYFLVDGRMVPDGGEGAESRIYLLNLQKRGAPDGDSLLRLASSASPLLTGQPATLPPEGVPFQAVLPATEAEVKQGWLQMTASLWTAPPSARTTLSMTPRPEADTHTTFEGTYLANGRNSKWLMRWDGLKTPGPASGGENRRVGRITLIEYGTFRKGLPVIRESSPWRLSGIRLEPGAAGRNAPRVYRLDFTHFRRRTETAPRAAEQVKGDAALPPLRFTFTPAGAFAAHRDRIPAVLLHSGR